MDEVSRPSALSPDVFGLTAELIAVAAGADIAGVEDVIRREYDRWMGNGDESSAGEADQQERAVR